MNGVDARQEVMAAAEARAAALARGDAHELGRLLHPAFRWTSHAGESFDREEYIRRNTGGQTVWRTQTLDSADVVLVGPTAVLHAEVTDVVGAEEPETFTMPMTQVWVREDGQWLCLAGHAGPRR